MISNIDTFLFGNFSKITSPQTHADYVNALRAVNTYECDKDETERNYVLLFR